MTDRRALALTVLAVLLGLAGMTASYVKLELAEPGPFADRAVTALDSREVRAVISEQVAVQMLERGTPDLVASRPLVLIAVEAILETEQFERVLKRSAVAAHEVLFRGDSDVVVELEEARDLLAPAVESVSPQLARQLPNDFRPRIAEIRRTSAATRVAGVAEGASAVAIPLLVVAIAVLALVVALAPDRRRALARTGLVLAIGAAGGLLVMAALRAQLVSQSGNIGVLSKDDARVAAGATWDALAGGLQRGLLIIGVAGLAVWVGALLAEARVDGAAALRHVAEIVAGGSLPRSVRMLRGLALAALGALILLGAEPLLATVVLVLGGALLLLGIAETLATATAGRRPRTGHVTGRRRRVAMAAGAAVLVAAVAVAVVVSATGGRPAPLKQREITACNGLAELCDRRLDEVVLPGTHNSMSAADRPGWFFANQDRPIPRQLREGIRLLMIDPHYGVVDAQGRVRTDLAAEGTNRNRVARQLGTESVRVAERLAGRLGLVPAAGRREIFLCHTLCELGAESMSSTLGEIRGFLERNRAEVLVVFLESSIDPREVEREFGKADLGPYLATLRRGTPLPTLRDLITSGRRLIVLDERDGGDAGWYQPGFVFAQDTRISSLLESRTACEPNRGIPENPLFLMNHWIDRFPPPPSENRRISDRGTLLRRVRSCREVRGRVPGLIAVDFYDRGAVIATARELNRSGEAAARGG